MSLLHLPGKHTAAVRLLFAGGYADNDPADRPGLTEMMLRTAITASRRLTSGAMAAELDRLSAMVAADCGCDSTSVSFLTPVELLTQTATTVVEALTAPRFDADDSAIFGARLRAMHSAARRTLRHIAVATVEQQIHALASRYATPELPGDDRDGVYGAESLAAQHAAYFSSRNLRMIVAGDLDRTDAPAILARAFEGWQTAGHTAGPVLGLSSPQWSNRPFPGARQAAIALGRLVPVTDLRRAVAAEVVATMLGGWSGSRLHTSLRNEAGLTYSIDLNFAPRLSTAGSSVQFTLSSQVEAARARDAWQLIRHQLDAVCARGMSPDEVRATTNWMLRSQLLCLDTPNQVTAQHGRWARGGFPITAGRQRARILSELTAEEVSTAANDLLLPELLCAAAVGPAAGQLPGFVEAG
ncbi:pitrilysin family protein [Catellatospora sp. TT07R-123]|uniref:M16 family metallopeptidase n=1 Tax=Catellatospora sp. TT07R-123 TaxID=2733863 RepID=UPI001BB408EE|nr:insulinase family protein [Catellatospora sp. TT07R-123]